jgi:hypothetical protein
VASFTSLPLYPRGKSPWYPLDRRFPNLKAPPSCISVGVDISPATDSVNFRSDRKELISLIKFVENFNLYNKPECCVVSEAFSYTQEYLRRRHVVEIYVHVVRKPHTSQCRAMPHTETKLTCMKQVSHLNVIVPFLE